MGTDTHTSITMSSHVAARIRYKISALLVLIIVFLLLGNAWTERKTAQLTRSFDSVYTDRLLAESYLRDLTDLLHREDRVLQQPEANAPLVELRTELFALDTALDRIILNYADTYLTTEEKVTFSRLKTHLAMVRELEQLLLASPDRAAWLAHNNHRFDQVFALASSDLKELSRIQLAVGYELTQRSTSLLGKASIFSKLQLFVVLIAGMLIQTLLSDARLTLAKAPEGQRLN